MPTRVVALRAAATAYAALLPLLLWRTLVLGSAHVPFDFFEYNFPLAATAYRALAEGQAPLWDPYTLGGIALTTNPQVGLFFPPQLVVFGSEMLMGASELSPYGYQWVAIINWSVLSVGTFLLAWRVTSRLGAGVLASSLVSVAGFLIAQNQHPGMVGAFSAFPWAVLFFLMLLKSSSWRRSTGPFVGLSVALAYSVSAGWLPASADVIASVFVVAIASIALVPGARWRSLWLLIAATTIALCLNAAVLLAIAADPSPSSASLVTWPVSGSQFWSLLTPNPWRLLEWPGGWGVDPTLHMMWGGAFFLPLLVASAVVKANRLQRSLLISAVALAAWAIFSSVWIDAAAESVPALALFRPMTFLPPAFILACVCAGSAWAWRGSLRGSRARHFYILCGVLGVAMLIVAMIAAPLDTPIAVAWVIYAVGVVLFVAYLLPKLPKIAICALIALIVLEGVYVIGNTKFMQWDGPPETPSMKEPAGNAALGRLLREQPGLVAANNQSLPAEWASFWPLWRIRSASGRQPFVPASWARAASSASLWYDDRSFGFDNFRSGRLEILGVSAVVTVAGTQRPLPGSRRLFANDQITVWSIPRAQAPARIRTGRAAAPVTLSVALNGQYTGQVPCARASKDATLEIVGALDTRWSAMIGSTNLSRAPSSPGIAKWAVPKDLCGTLVIRFHDTAFAAGIFLSTIAGVFILTLAGLSVVNAARARRHVPQSRTDTGSGGT